MRRRKSNHWMTAELASTSCSSFSWQRLFSSAFSWPSVSASPLPLNPRQNLTPAMEQKDFFYLENLNFVLKNFPTKNQFHSHLTNPNTHLDEII